MRIVTRYEIDSSVRWDRTRLENNVSECFLWDANPSKRYERDFRISVASAEERNAKFMQ